MEAQAVIVDFDFFLVATFLPIAWVDRKVDEEWVNYLLLILIIVNSINSATKNCFDMFKWAGVNVVVSCRPHKIKN